MIRSTVKVITHGLMAGRTREDSTTANSTVKESINKLQAIRFMASGTKGRSTKSAKIKQNTSYWRILFDSHFT
jgi:hypothetical protein